jgi:hypothetical protein
VYPVVFEFEVERPIAERRVIGLGLLAVGGACALAAVVLWALDKWIPKDKENDDL